MITKIKNEQINKDLPWAKQMIEIGQEDGSRSGRRKGRQQKNMENKGESIFRARTDIMDPKPRKTYCEKTIWRCKFCNEKSQSSRHYVEFCVGTERYFKEKIDRKIAWQIISTLEDGEGKMMTIASILQKIIKDINN